MTGYCCIFSIRWFSARNPRGPTLETVGLVADCLGATVDAFLDLSILVDAPGRRHRWPKA
jgi:hypothetical protein